MSTTLSRPMLAPEHRRSTFEQLMALGADINTNQYRAVHLAAQFDEEREWFAQGLKSAAFGISRQLDLHTSTASEWIRVGHSLQHLPQIDAAFGANKISYAKARILTRWADTENEEQLLQLAHDCTANRLTTAIAKVLAENDPDDGARDQRHHQLQSVTSYTDGDGMTIIRIALPPAIGKPVLAAVDVLVHEIANTPITDTPTAAAPTTSNPCSSADDPDTKPQPLKPLSVKLAEIRERWHPPQPDDDWCFPTTAQQRADAFVVLFGDLNIRLATEVVIHVRGDGNTFDDGTPITTSAICRQLDYSFIRALIHDASCKPIDATNRRRHPTTRQKRVVLETHNHQCVDCQSTQLLELDHNPPYGQTKHTITTELQPRCAPCHRAPTPSRLITIQQYRASGRRSRSRL